MVFRLTANLKSVLRHNLRSETMFGKLKPFKNDEKYFSFHLKGSFCSKDI